MPTNLIPFLYTGVFFAFLVITVPRAEIRRLAIYGIIFGGLFDIVIVSAASLMGEFKYINYEPFGLFGLHFMAPISWAIFFIIYFYFLPEKKIYLYIYTIMGVVYSMLFCQMLTKLGILSLAHGLIDSIVPFAPWFPLATWGYLKLTSAEHNWDSVHTKQHYSSGFMPPAFQPAAKPLNDTEHEKQDRE